MGDCGIGYAIKNRIKVSLEDKAKNPESSNPKEEYYERLFLPDFIEADLKKKEESS